MNTQPDLLSEQLVPISQVCSILPSTRRGKKLHYGTVWRWATRGCRGRVLETIRTGGNVYTSKEALRRFTRPGPAQAVPTSAATKANRQRTIERAESFLDEQGV